jgi:hypothetical protein
MRPHLNQQLGAVAHTYHPKLYRRLRSKRRWFQVSETSSQKGGHDSAHLSSQLQWEISNRRVAVQAILDKKQDPTSKITRAKTAGDMA